MDIQLNSVSKPKPIPSATEAAPLIEPRKLLDGASGPASQGEGRSRRLLVTGSKPLERRGRTDFALETVIGVDDRTRILETEQAPWRMICALKIVAPVGTAIGTGWFAGPRTVITAGHCVHAVQMGGWADRIEVSPGRDETSRPFGTAAATRFSTVDRWVESADPDFDYAAIHLDEPLGEQTGWFSTAALPRNELDGARVNVSGYPADLAPAGDEQWFHANRVLRVSARRLYYDVDTYGGQSGSPVWLYAGDKPDDDPIVVGVHAYGVGGTPSSFGVTANSAPRIIPEVWERIREWVEADAGS